MKSLTDLNLIRDARGAAEQILSRDPELTRHPLLVQKLDLFKAQVHLE
jgi:hypothetical protein